MARRPSLFVAVVAVAVAAGVAHAFMNFNQPCAGYTCTSAQLTPVPKKDYLFTANGCGTAALPIQSDTDFTECCNWHDVCYSTCGMKKTACEKRFDKCMRGVCATLRDASAREKCDSTAKLFQLGAQMAGCAAYQQAQREACTCVATHKAPHAQRQRLVYFLQENGASADELKPERVEALLDKYKGQEPKMFLRLAVKYPTSVRVDASKTNFMEEMFKPLDLDGKTKKDAFTVGLEEQDEANDAADEPPVDEHIEL